VERNGAEHHETRSTPANSRNRVSSFAYCKNVECPAEMTSLLRDLPASDNDDYDNDNRAVPSTPCRDAADINPIQTSSSFQVKSMTQSSDLRRSWTSLKRWLTPGCAPTPAIGLSDLRPRHIRLPVRTDAGHLSCRSDPVPRLPSVLDDEDRFPTTGCCFVRSRDAAGLMSASPGVAVCGTTATYVSSVVSSDAISTARLLGDSAGRGTCSLTAAAAVNAACEPLLCPPSRVPRASDDDNNTIKGDCVTTAASRRLRDSGIAFIDE